MKDNGSIIDRAFRKEIGIDINKAICIINREGIAPEELGEITTCKGVRAIRNQIYQG